VVFGRPAGAPLGTYDPLNLAGLDPFNPFVFISGTFNRFSDAEILARYPTRQAYVCSVALAAVSAAVRHYITGDDAEALIEAARNEPLPVGTQRASSRAPMRVQFSANHSRTAEVDFSIDSNAKGSYKAVLSYARRSDVLREFSKVNLRGIDYRHSTRTGSTI
jgi:Alpha/beta hydrolase domain